MKHFQKKFAAALTAGILAGSSAAHAGGSGKDFSDITGNIVSSSADLPNLISTVAYVGGIGMGVAGVFKLKQHVDNPGQHPMKDGLVRLGAGGGLLALPAVTEAMVGTIGEGESVKADTLQFDAANFGNSN